MSSVPVPTEKLRNQPHAIVDELELAHGAARSFRTVWLRCGRCPERCVFCDLPSYGEAEPLGPERARAQLETALPPGQALPWGLKLYNGSSFFEPRSIEPAAQELLLERAARCERIVVESRPEFGAQALAAARRWPDRLEVALGLEVADDGWLHRLGKRTTAGAYFATAAELSRAGIAVRAFVLLGLPGLDPAAALELCLQTLEACAERGIGSVSILPTAATTQALRRAQARGDFAPPAMTSVFAAARRALDLGLLTRIDLSFHFAPLGCDRCRAVCQALNQSGALPELSCPCVEF
ncbi:MAG TPA: hypothetical protein VGB99_10935 [Acidobacteriota bacterium]